MEVKEKEFSRLVDQYGEKLYWLVRHIVLTHEDADDVVQNAFIRAWVYFDKFEGKSSISTWLSRIAINEALDYVRRRQKEGVSAGEDLSLANRLMADPYFDGDETAAQLQDAVARLPEVQRTVFQLRYFQGMKYREISEIMGTSEGALKADYHYAKEKIKEYFDNID